MRLRTNLQHRVRVTDQGGLFFDKSFVIQVNSVNSAPTDISLSTIAVDENQPSNTVVGGLSAADHSPGSVFTFSPGCAAPGANDGSFNILGMDLRTSAAFDFEAKSVYNICIRVTDQGGLPFDKGFAITVNSVDELTNTPGKVTGGGEIGSNKESGKATFGFTINFSEGDSEPKGNLIYQDHKTKLRLKATTFDRLLIDGNHAWFTGSGVLDDGQVVRFTVEIEVSPETF